MFENFFDTGEFFLRQRVQKNLEIGVLQRMFNERRAQNRKEKEERNGRDTRVPPSGARINQPPNHFIPKGPSVNPSFANNRRTRYSAGPIRDSRGGRHFRNDERYYERRPDAKFRDNRYQDNFKSSSTSDIGHFKVQTVPLEELRPQSSMWDKAAKGFEGLRAKFAKSSGLFASPSVKLYVEPTKEQIELLLQNQSEYLKREKERQSERNLQNALEGKISKQLYITGLDLDNSNVEKIQKYLESFLASAFIPNVSFDDTSLNCKLNGKHERILVECKKSLVATVLMSLNGKIVDESDIKLQISRPNDYIEMFLEESVTSDMNVKEEIRESSQLWCANNVPDNTSNERLKEILEKYGQVKSLVILVSKLTYENMDIAFFEFKSPITSQQVKDLSETESLNCFQPCVNESKKYFQKVQLTMENIKKYVNSDTLSNEASRDISKHEITSTIQLLNCCTPLELLNKDKYQSLYNIFHLTMSKMPGFVQLFIPRPMSETEIEENPTTFGKIVVKFENGTNATDCLNNTCGRYFNSRVVIGSYIDDDVCE